jgi:hypothetical protein
MALEDPQTAPVDGGPGTDRPVVMQVAEPARRLDRLAPLIHELIAWDLVYRTESGTFVLHDDVQERLVALAELRPNPAAQVYVGRLCNRCGTVGVTRLLDGVHVCAACRSAEHAGPPADPPAPPDREHRSRWHRKAG